MLIKSFLPKLKLVSKIVVLSVVMLSMLMVAVLEGPNQHRLWLRNKVASHVFEIRGTKDGGGGTGFQIKAATGNSFIVTNSHVCEHVIEDSKNKDSVLVIKDDRSISRRVLKIDEKSDLCLIEGWPGMSGLSLGSEAKVGDSVMAIGHPSLDLTTLTMGEVRGNKDVRVIHHFIDSKESLEACNQEKMSVETFIFSFLGIPFPLLVCVATEKQAIKTNITIFPGSSGSPLVNRWGNVVGVMFAANPRENWGCAVNLEHLEDLLKDF